MIYDETQFDVSGMALCPETGGILMDGKRCDRAGGSGYMRVCRNRNRVMAHRIAWRIHYGEWPSAAVDHRDGNRSNNRISNLRLASSCENAANASSRASQTHERGVLFGSYGRDGVRRYRVNVQHQGRRVQEYASSFFSAVCAARLIRRVLHGEFAFENRRAA